MSINPEAVERILREQLDLMVRKNADYSSDNIRVDGLRGVAVRLVDKVARLRNLLSKPESDRNFESVLDTLRDISNYGVIGQLLESGEWGRDFESVFILAERGGLPDVMVDRIESHLEDSGISFSWLDDIGRYSGTPYPYSRSRAVHEKLVDISDVVLVVGFPRPAAWRLVEYAVQSGRRVVIDSSIEVYFDDTENFESLEAALSYITEAGVSNVEE